MPDAKEKVKGWRPYPSWGVALAGAVSVMAIGIGLKFYLLSGDLGLDDITPPVLAGLGWFAVSAFMGESGGRENQRER